MPPTETPRGRLEKVLAVLVPGANPAGAVYGTITMGALLAAESGIRESYPETVGAAAMAIALYWLAHSYAELLGARLESGERLTPPMLRRALRRDWPIVRGALAPLASLLLCWALAVNLEKGVQVAVWVAAVSVVAFELLAGLYAKARPAELLLEGCVGVAMGLAMLALRAILH
ncbi:MAG TPA: hypothetical protein VMU32_10980 [Solirubrobacteraceae bacterium]|nr:hypothetical protein [Solirubrobacteraceae bacterium]